MISQVQQCNSISGELANYLQINTLYAPDSTIAADLRYQRPIVEYNSYQRLFAEKSWDVASLKDDSRTLTIIEGEEGDLRMSYGGKWTEKTRAEDEETGWWEGLGLPA
ncbi:hypothetical protein BU23DRAFT_548584 [Bimuria novae-zelandiae CBS 107.79]|uniref:Uncharacterized protein n=1 Tax=Bimuria novae-zelandiae CBS 107.79 TaxID=1447943 RepID=A0A6A5VST9_9PLEO|nr:hypothetical protein BU23DRAFT_548584 [Bimuria novae-zelandiae CBS 107.79]